MINFMKEESLQFLINNPTIISVAYHFSAHTTVFVIAEYLFLIEACRKEVNTNKYDKNSAFSRKIY
jgi:hypothetical protein